MLFLELISKGNSVRIFLFDETENDKFLALWSLKMWSKCILSSPKGCGKAERKTSFKNYTSSSPFKNKTLSETHAIQWCGSNPLSSQNQTPDHEHPDVTWISHSLSPKIARALHQVPWFNISITEHDGGLELICMSLSQDIIKYQSQNSLFNCPGDVSLIRQPKLPITSCLAANSHWFQK